MADCPFNFHLTYSQVHYIQLVLVCMAIFLSNTSAFYLRGKWTTYHIFTKKKSFKIFVNCTFNFNIRVSQFSPPHPANILENLVITSTDYNVITLLGLGRWYNCIHTHNLSPHAYICWALHVFKTNWVPTMDTHNLSLWMKFFGLWARDITKTST